MITRFVVCTVAMAILVVTAPAAPKAPEQKECPVAGGPFDLDKVEAALRGAPTCGESSKVFGLCGMGGGSDVAMGGIVTERCEAEFLSRLDQRRRRAYRREQERCSRKYRNESGSMYRSAEAYCVSELAARYARKFGKVKR
jgi:hypothetical protein